MEEIRLENVIFEYPNGFRAIDDVSMSIKKGEKVAIIGQNGAGKTTLVKMMNGLLRPVSGKVIIDGEDIINTTTATVSKKVGYVFQNPGDQIFNKDVYTEIAYSPKYMKLEEAEIERRVKDASSLCGLDEHLDINPYDLPFGLRKFVTIAAVIAMDCDYIILDEPTAGQDLDGLIRQKEIIEELHRRGKTVITITHDMKFVIQNFERVIVMANKKKVGDDLARNIFWNEEVLKRADLGQPNVLSLANYLGIQKNIINIQEFAEEF